MRVLIILISTLGLSFGVCPRFPKKFSQLPIFSLVGEPTQYVPGSVYEVHVESKTAFTEFIITNEARNGEGNYQIINPTESTFADDCVNTVVESNRNEKNSVTVLWTSPQEGCVDLRAAVKTLRGWLSSNITICRIDVLMPKLDTTSSLKCCACDHARFKIVFQGIWSPETHPRDFPSVLWLTHFSDVIGATHTPNFSMWGEGQIASYGFKQLAEYGVVREMEIELRNQSTQLRSIIKAAGLWHPDLNGNTTAIFRADPRRHLLSLASMFGPSPDWVVGVSSLDLCTKDCSWIESQVIDLLPYDAGTDNGITYMSPNVPTEPQEKIRQITTMYPEDPRSPFYDPAGGKIPPLAKLYITREGLIKKKCSDLSVDEIQEQVSQTENTEEIIRPECAVTPYSTWTLCSVTCGKGLRMRTRKYVNEEKAESAQCNRQLVSKEMCVSSVPVCPGDEEEEIATLVPPGECDVSEWSEWSDCTVTCGIGLILRSRTFTNPGASKRCSMLVATMEKQKCMLPPCISSEKMVIPACEVSDWSLWSPCTTTCGKGVMERIRLFVSPNPPAFCRAITKTTEIVGCNTNKDCEMDQSEWKKMCAQPFEKGPCRGNFTRWGFNPEINSCEKFQYGGCRGNMNRFSAVGECQGKCIGKSLSPVNCVVSKWGPWSSCNPCVNGTRTKTRSIVVHPKNGGRKCPDLSFSVRCSIPIELCQFSENPSDFK